MKRASKTVFGFAAGILVVGMVVLLNTQRQSLNRALEENRALRQRVEELSAQADQLAADNARFSGLLPNAQTNIGARLGEEPSSELLRLRGEVGRLRFQQKEFEQSRREQMQAAQAKLSNAEVELAKLTKLHAENVVSVGELAQARYRVELLKAEARGDETEAGQVRLRHAEDELARAKELREKSLISQAEYDGTVQKVESLRGGGK